MNCFHHPIEIKAKIARDQSRFNHLPLASASGAVPTGDLIRRCLREISPDEPERGIAAAKVMQCVLREMSKQDKVKRSLAEYYGINYLLTSLNQAIHAYEQDGRVDELMFVTMRIGREVGTYQYGGNAYPVDRLF